MSGRLEKGTTVPAAFHRISRLMTLLLFSLMAVLGCGRDDSSHNDDSPRVDDPDDDNNAGFDVLTTPCPCESGNFFYFDLTPDNHDIPFPSALFLRRDEGSPTGLRVRLPEQVTTYLDPVLSRSRSFLQPINELDGFGVSNPIWFHTNAAPDLPFYLGHAAPTLADPLICMVLEEPGHPHNGELWRIDASYLGDLGLLQITPHLPFAQNTTYACVITHKLFTTDGRCYQTPEHLRYLIAGQPDPDHPDYDLLELHRPLFSPLFAELTAQYGIQPAEIVGATFFHTQWITHDLESIRRRLDDLAGTRNIAVGPWERQMLNDIDADVDSIWEAPYDTIEWRRDGVFVHDATGNPQPAGRTSITLRLALPNSAKHRPPYPVVIFGHGLLDSRRQSDFLIDTLAEYGFATASIDWLFHGDRHEGVLPLPLGLAVVERFLQFNPVLKPHRMRDNYLQGVADILWLRRVIRSLDTLDLAPAETGGDGIPDLDGERVFYAGLSMGAAHGTILAAVEPQIDTYLLMSGAANWRASVLDGNFEGVMAQINALMLNYLKQAFRFEKDNEIDLFYQLQLTIAGGGDPYSYTAYVVGEPLFTRSRGTLNLLHQMSVMDGVIGELGGSELARSLGITLLQPYTLPIESLPSGDTPFVGPAVFQYNVAEHTFMVLPEHASYDAGHRQMGVFFRTAADLGSAVIINPFTE